MSSEDEFGAVSYLAPQSFEGHRALARQFSINDSGIVDFHGSRNSSRIGLAIPNNSYCDWDEHSDPRTPTSAHAFFQRTNSHPSPASPWTNQLPAFVQAPDKYVKVPDYEELPNSTKHPDDVSVYTPIDEGCVTVATLKKSQKATSPSEKQAQINSSTNRQSSRLRTNPLYDQSGGSFSLPPYPPSKPGSRAGGLCCLQVFGFLFALMALAWVLISFLAGGTRETEYYTLVKDIEGLRSNLSRLYQMLQNGERLNNSTSLPRINDFNAIVQLLLNNSGILETRGAFGAKITALKSLESQVNETFENLKLSIGERNQLEMLRFANMSACSHRRKSVGTSSKLPTTVTETLDLSQVLVLGVLCTTVGGTEALLDDSQSKTNYTCICRGVRGREDVREGEHFRHCIIHYWTCPLLMNP